MKKQILFLLLSIHFIKITAQESRFKDNETLNVWASSGLNMRDKPDAKAAKIATIPYAAKVIVQPQIGVKIPFEVEEFKGFVVKGYWLLVKYGTTEGWVFDGFLSRLPAPKKEKEVGIHAYLDRNVSKVGNKFGITIWDYSGDSTRFLKPNEKVTEDKIYNYNQRYQHNILFEKEDSEIGTGFTITTNQLTVYELYFLVKTLVFDPKLDDFTIENKLILMQPKDREAGCYYGIGVDENKIVKIGAECGC